MKLKSIALVSRSGRVGGHRSPVMFESLEQRALLSTYLYEGRTGLFETDPHPIDQIGTRGGGSLVVVGDVDGDGVNDLAGGFDGYTIVGRGTNYGAGYVGLYSGKSGALIRELSDRKFGFGTALAPIGDFDHDGVPDLVVSNYNAIRGTVPSPTYLAVYSGKNGSVLLRRDPQLPTFALGQFLQALGDLDNDGVGDFASIDSRSSVAGLGPFAVTMYSGATLTPLWVNTADLILDPKQGVVSLSNVGDLNGDGTPDLVSVAGSNGLGTVETKVVLISGIDGALMHAWTFPSSALDGPTILGRVASVSDRNGDSTRDLAIFQYHLGNGTTPYQVAFYSGKAFEAIGSLDSLPHSGLMVNLGDTNGDGWDDLAIANQGAFTDTGVDSVLGHRVSVISGLDGAVLQLVRGDIFQRTVSDLIVAGDLNGDGLADLAIGSNFSGAYGYDPESSLFTVSGAALSTPVVVGVNARGAAWGTIGTQAFITMGGRAVTTAALNGFLTGDRVLSISLNGTVLGENILNPGHPFVRRTDGTRVELANYTFAGRNLGVLRAIALSSDPAQVSADGRIVFVRRDIDGTPAGWSLSIDSSVADLIRADIPAAMTPDGIRFVFTSADRTQTYIMTDRGGVEQINEFEPIAINNDRAIAGLRIERDRFTGAITRIAAVWQANTFTDVGTKANAKAVIPIAINSSGVVLARYRDQDRLVIRRGDGTAVDIAPKDWIGAPADFDTDTPMLGLGLTDRGDVLGLSRGSDVFSLRPLDTTILEATANAPFDSAPWRSYYGRYGQSTEGTATVMINPAGKLVAALFGVPPGSQYYDNPAWHTYSYSAPAGYTFGSEVAVWTDHTGAPVAAVTTDHGVLLYDLNSGSYRDLSLETGGVPITHDLVKLNLADGRRLIAGLTGSNDLVLYGESYGKNFTYVWVFDNLSNSAFRDLGFDPPVFDTVRGGKIVGYTTPWGGLNIAGVDTNGQVLVVWTAPDRGGWTATNLTQVVGNTDGYFGARFDHLQVTVAPWGGISVYGGTDAKTFWWAPALGGVWRYTTLANAISTTPPELVVGTTHAYVTAWGGLNIAGLDREGKIQVYWWAPGQERWIAERLDAKITTPHAAYTGQLTSAATADSIYLFAHDTTGHLHRLALTGPGTWVDVDVTDATLF